MIAQGSTNNYQIIDTFNTSLMEDSSSPYFLDNGDQLGLLLVSY